MSRPNSEYGTSGVHIACWTLLFVFALLELSCGTRRVDAQIQKESSSESTKTSDKEQSTSKGEVKKEESKSDQSKSSEENKDVEENYKKIIKESYDEQGRLKERITELEKIKKDKTSSKQNESVKTSYLRVDSIFNVTNYKNVVITTHKEGEKYSKDKKSETSNRQWAWVVFGLGMVGLLFWLKPWQKRV